MNKLLLKLTLALFTVLALLGLNQVYAASSPIDIHADAKMRQAGGRTVEQTYGYLRVRSDGVGNGLVDVMFSNGSPRLKARFNARVEFIDSAGRVVREEHFSCRLDRASRDSARECKVSRMLKRSWFDKIEVDFYLTEFSKPKFVSMVE